MAKAGPQPVPKPGTSPKPGAKAKPEEKIVATNRRAWHEFDIEERFEAGLQLAGSEVKSLRAGRVDLVDAYAEIHQGELWIANLKLTPVGFSPYTPPPSRRRKLLIHRAELDRLVGRTSRKGMTLVPLKVYFTPRGWAKVELGLAKGRTHRDRREQIKKREAEREIRGARDE